MQTSIPSEMKAAAIDQYGGPEVLHTERLPVPKPKADEVLIALDLVGIGVWDPYVRTGEFELGGKKFPKVIGNDGAGAVAAVGEKVKRFQPGDRVYAYTMRGGFYAEYIAVKEPDVAPIPRGLSTEEAGALGADGITALRGLEDQLQLKSGQSLLIFGASGGIGHLAVQLAKRLGARVYAVASGPDGVELVRRLGADFAIDGKHENVGEALRACAPNGLDAALVLVNARGLGEALTLVHRGGRIAHPNGVEPEPRAPEGVELFAYDGNPSPEAFARLNELIAKGPFHVEVGKTFALDEAAQAHREIEKHHLGKLALRVH
jgi:NADPH2:quinone reductase